MPEQRRTIDNLLEWERTHYEQYLSERSDRYRREKSANGGLNPQVRARSDLKLLREYVRDLVENRMELRREIAASNPEALSEGLLSQVQADLAATASAEVQSFYDELGSRIRMIAGHAPRPTGYDSERHSLTAEFTVDIRRSIHKLKTEHTVENTAESSARKDVMIPVPTIDALGISSTVGELNTSLSQLEHKGAAGIAADLRKLAESVAPMEQLGDERILLIEALAVLASHAAKPDPQRKPSLMKLNWEAAAKILSTAPELDPAVGPLTAQLRQWFKW